MHRSSAGALVFLAVHVLFFTDSPMTQAQEEAASAPAMQGSLVEDRAARKLIEANEKGRS